MADKDQHQTHKRMIVEEVGVPETPKPQILEEAAKTEEPAIANTEPIVDTSPEVAPVIPEKIPEPEKQKSPVLWILISGIFILGAVLGGIFFYQKGVNKTDETPTPEPTVQPNTQTSTPSASPAAAVDLTKYTVAILNGSGTVGEAGKVKELLTTAGFKVGTTGNAASYDYTETIIKAKSTVDKDFLAKLSTAIGKSYVVGTSETLSTSSAVEVQVIVGTSKAE